MFRGKHLPDETRQALLREMESEQRGTSWLDTVAHFTTAHGSTYTVLPDGTIARHKKRVTPHDQTPIKEPYELMAFLPTVEQIMQAAPAAVLQKLGSDANTFVANFASYFRGAIQGYKGYITDSTGKKFQTSQEVCETDGQIWAIIVDTRTNTTFVEVPLLSDPAIGRAPVEMHRIPNEDGTHNTSRHVGHAIVAIDLK